MTKNAEIVQISIEIDGLTLKIVGSFLILSLILNVVLNSTLLLVFYRYRKLRTPVNMLIIVTTIFNLFGSVQFPFVIYSNIVNKYKLNIYL